ncbi:MAG: hypothetical protein ACI80F_002172 [Natronomonas sp.]|jgi:hypothetical protein|uniref:DUF7546 family protein n=1 Tax=Natronomonas sp. TaxID=2184060 RepID=UPI0039893CD5
MTTTPTLFERARTAVPERRRLARYALVVNLQLVGVALYYSVTNATLRNPRYVAFGLLWVNIGLFIIRTVRPPSDVPFRTRRRAVALAATYFGVLAAVGGMLGTGLGESATGLRVAWLTPGWGPALVYGGADLSVVLMPAYVVGYTALAYLVYVTVLEASGAAIGGLLGLLSCVSCTWPIIAATGSALLGGTGFLAASAMETSYDLSTAVFLVTVLLLYWRPGFE